VAESESDASSVTQDSTGSDELDASFDELGQSLAEAFEVGTGVGVYTTAIGGLAVTAGGLLKLKDRNAAKRCAMSDR
jgi:hypothetical protein